MNNPWYSFLTGDGVKLDDHFVAPFTTVQEEAEAVTEQTVVTPLLQQGVIRVSGEDAATFLQNQLTNDVRKVDDERSQLTAWCSPKGRVLTCLRLFRTPEGFHLLLPATLLPGILERLQKYVLISKVKLEDAGDVLALLGIAGSEAGTLLQKQGLAVPGETNHVARGNGITLLRIPGPVPRFVVAGDAEELIPLWSTLADSARPVGSPAWELLNIRAGLPEIHPETVEAFVPQMINLDLLDGVSFDKGCYPGQEVVARLRYLGKLKRRMYRARLENTSPPSPGEPLLLGGDGRETGKVVTAQPDGQGGSELLAVLEIASVEGGEPIVPTNSPATALEFLQLPYSLQ